LPSSPEPRSITFFEFDLSGAENFIDTIPFIQKGLNPFEILKEIISK
jgi:hypothetical protein